MAELANIKGEAVLEVPASENQVKLPLARRSWAKLGAFFGAAMIVYGGISNILTNLSNNVESIAKMAKSGREVCEFADRCAPRSDPNNTVVVQAPAPPVVPQVTPPHPVENAILRADRDPVIRAALTNAKPSIPTHGRDGSFDAPQRNRIVTVKSEDSVSLCERYGMIVYGPERTGMSRLQLRQPGALPSERRDLAFDFDVAEPVGPDCAVKVSRSGDTPPLYSFEEITGVR